MNIPRLLALIGTLLLILKTAVAVIMNNLFTILYGGFPNELLWVYPLTFHTLFILGNVLNLLAWKLNNGYKDPFIGALFIISGAFVALPPIINALVAVAVMGPVAFHWFELIWLSIFMVFGLFYMSSGSKLVSVNIH